MRRTLYNTLMDRLVRGGRRTLKIPKSTFARQPSFADPHTQRVNRAQFKKQK